jgi:hypothetical protein
MKNNKKKFYTVLSLSAPRFIKNSYYFIASSHYLGSISEPYTINSPIFAKRLEMLYDNKIKIVVISDKFTKVYLEKPGDSISTDFRIVYIPTDLFLNNNAIEKLLIKNKKINQYIFIFEGLQYAEIVYKLAFYNIIVSGGSNTKKHILSPIQLRLARFLIAILPVTGSKVVNSFHSNRINQIPRIDLTSKEAKKITSQYIE